MKTLILLLFILAMLPSLFAQQSTIGIGTTWMYYHIFEPEVAPFDGFTRCYKYVIDGDTIIDGVEYFTLHYNDRTTTTADVFPYNAIDTYTDIDGGFIRYNEQENVFRHFQYDDTGSSLVLKWEVNFNFNLGDTITTPGSGVSGGDPVWVVDSISYLVYDNDSLKVFWLGDPNCYYHHQYCIYEKIGASYGFGEYGTMCLEWDYTHSVIQLFMANGDTLLQSEADLCDPILSTNNPASETSISIIPNPVSDIMTVRGLKENATVQMISTGGSILGNFSISSTQTQIPIPASLPNGLYFVRIISPYGQQTQRVVLMRG